MAVAIAKQKPLVNIQEVRRTYNTLVEPGQVIELRALDAIVDRASYRKTYGGYFDNCADLARELSRIKAAMGIYITLQELDPDLLHRAKNKIIEQRKDYSTPDKNVKRYRWLPLDCDIDRDVKLISSSDEEHEQALAHAKKVKQFLIDQGWPVPIETDSGNGAHLLIRIDLPATEETADLLKRVLKGIADQTNSDTIKLDQSVYNPARIWKLYGTLVCKGDDTSERPYRMAQILSIPTEMMVASQEQLESIAVPHELPAKPTPIRKVYTTGKVEQTLEEYLQAQSVLYHDVTRNGIVYHILDNGCVFNPDHRGYDAAVFVAASGKWSYHCFHDSCGERHWKDFRLQIEPDAYSRQDKIISHPAVKHESYETLKTAVLDALDKQDAEALYNLVEQIVRLSTREQAILDALVKKSKWVSLSDYNKLRREALKEYLQEQKQERLATVLEYERTDLGMCYNSPFSGDPLVLSNFTAEIVADIVTDDGAEQTRKYGMVAGVGNKRASFELPIADFAKCEWPQVHLGHKARITVGQSMKAHLCNAIQFCSDAPEHYQYMHTGWRKIDGKMVYLHANGTVGQVGQVSISSPNHLTQQTLNTGSASQAISSQQNLGMGQVGQVGQVKKQVSVCLKDALANYALPDTCPDVIAAIRGSLKFLDLASDTVTVPLYASLWRSVLGRVDYGVHLVGQSGRGKSALCGTLQQHFGPAMHDHNLPGSWESTDNSLEFLMFQAKDTIVVVDDFKAKGTKNEQDRLHAKADRVFRQLGNGSARGRLNSNLEQRATRSPRCLLISTGEDTPRGQSLKARGVILTMQDCIVEEGTEASKRLAQAQMDASKGLYAQCTCAYLEWLAPRIEQLQEDLPMMVATERSRLSLAGHARTGTNTANMLIGMQHFLQFAVESGALSEAEKNTYLRRCERALLQIASDAAKENVHDKPSEQWKRLLESAIAGKSAHLVLPNGDMPGLEYGWTQRIRSVITSNDEIQEESYQGGGLQIGWIDGDDVYLLPMAAYKAAKAIGAATGDDITTLEPTLRKFLHQDNLLASTDIQTARNTITVRRRFQRLRYDVLHFKKATLFPEDDDTPLTPPDPLDPLDPTRVHAAPQADGDPARDGSSTVSGLGTSLDPNLTHVDLRSFELAPQADPGYEHNGSGKWVGSSEILAHDLTQTEYHEPVLAQAAPQADSLVGQVSTEKKSESVEPLDPALVKEMNVLIEQVDRHHTKVGNIIWRGPGSGYDNDSLDPNEYKARAEACRDSRDPVRMKAAIGAMRRTLGMEE